MQFNNITAQSLRMLALTLLLANSASAQIWDESINGGGDAPGLPPGQITSGVGPLTAINGVISNPDFDPDLYCISITDPANFSATTVGSSTVDLSLWLFDSNFNGVTHDGADDAPFGPNPAYQASLSSQFVVNPGVYFLAVTLGGVDALSNGSEIWLDTPTIESPPNGPGAPGPINGWSSPGFGVGGSYSIQLTGASYHVPEPTCAAYCVLGSMMSLATFRRR